MAEVPIRHIHIGAGRLGLGLIVPTTASCGLEVIVLNRQKTASSFAGGPDKHDTLRQRMSYVLRHIEYRPAVDQRRDIARETVRFQAYYTFTEGTAGLDPELERVMTGRPALTLLTTAVEAGNLTRVVPLISTIIDRHLSAVAAPGLGDNVLFITACENGHRVTDRLKEKVVEYLSSDGRSCGPLDRRVVFLNSVVDRVVSRDPVHENGELLVDVESFRKWIIEITDDASRLPAFDILRSRLAPDGVAYVPRRKFDACETLKYVGLNAVHLSLATLICWARYMDEGVEHDGAVRCLAQGLLEEEIRDKIMEIQGEIAQALDILTGGCLRPGEASAYVTEVLERTRKLDDPYFRIFQSLVRTGDRLDEARAYADNLFDGAIQGVEKDGKTKRLRDEFLRKFDYYVSAISVDPFITKLNERITSPIIAICMHRAGDGGGFGRESLRLHEILVKAIAIVEKRRMIRPEYCR
jgi:hypothetical protein